MSGGAVGPDRLQAWPPGPDAVAPGWQPVLNRFWRSSEGEGLNAFLRERLAAGAVIYPPEPLKALRLTPPEQVRVLVLGQDPYHGFGQAHGLAFDVRPDCKPPPSLRNIFKELAREYGPAPTLQSGLLAGWARQGVLLLNACLTVEDGQAGGHARRGWEHLTEGILGELQASARPLCVLLWGAHAQARWDAVAATRPAAGPRGVLRANHPSPLSALRPPVPFIGCGHFSQANAWLTAHGAAPVAWLQG